MSSEDFVSEVTEGQMVHALSEIRSLSFLSLSEIKFVVDGCLRIFNEEISLHNQKLADEEPSVSQSESPCYTDPYP